jgi:DNA-directed RNA polymerase specialized sigma24 family protein
MPKATPTPISTERAFDDIAAGLYSLASMLVGEGEDSIRLVETAVAAAMVSACASVEDAHKSSRRALATAAIDLLAERNPEGLAAPEDLEHAVTCIEDNDLDAAAEAREAMERMIAGPDRDRVRAWLESLPAALRTIYVLRAVAGFSAVDTAGLLAAHGGSLAAGWTPEMVRELFRQALCSLASQLIHATAGQ